MGPGKVAYLTPLYFDEGSSLGSAERYPLNLAAGVVEASGGTCAIDLISYGPEPLEREVRPGVTLRVLRAANQPAERTNVASWDLPAAIAGADLVHIHSAFNRAGELALLAAKQQRKPVCITDHGSQASTIGRNLASLDLADQVVAYSDFGASLLWTKSPIAIIKGGVDAAYFTPAPAPQPRTGFLFVGRLLPHKGIETLIAALPAELPLTVCGRPSHKDYTWRIQYEAIGKTVDWIIDADDARLRDLYRSAWATIVPAVYQDCFGWSHAAPELSGFALLESMACGTPVLCSRVGASPEFVREGQTGFVYDDPAELTARLRLLAGDPELVEQMGRLGRETVERHYDQRVAGRALLDIYRDLLARLGEAAA
jgi:glycosyltransferase involved in cell wall biosynthesis